MRPVKNKYKSFFEVGKYYKFKWINTLLRVTRVGSCKLSCSNYSDTRGCCRTIIQDEKGMIWCGITKNFKEVEE